MTSEGKLKERLLQKYIEEFAGSGERWYDYFCDREEQVDEAKCEFVELFNDVINEAKKEFPDYDMFETDDYLKNQKLSLDEKNSILKIERDRWFDKWFGE